MFAKIKKFIMDKDYRFMWFDAKGLLGYMNDETFLKKKFHALMGRDLDLNTPITFNEKLQWLKLNDRRPEYTMLVDKWRVRDHIKEKLGEDYLIPLLGVYDDPDEIDFDALPERFVLKCNHNSGVGMCICKDKSKLNIEKVKKELRKGLAQDYYLTGREWPYKDVSRKIIAEQYMEDTKTKELRDYKFYCFSGIPKIIMVNSGRGDGETTADYYDMDRNYLDFTWGYPHSNNVHILPENFELMKQLATVLSADIPHIRIDFYEVNGKVYIGELTFFDGSGFDIIVPESWDFQIGSWIEIDEVNNRR